MIWIQIKGYGFWWEFVGEIGDNFSKLDVSTLGRLFGLGETKDVFFLSKSDGITRDVSYFFWDSLPETNSSPLKNDGWKMNFLLGGPIFRGFQVLYLGYRSRN